MGSTYRLGDSILLHADEVHTFIKVHLPKPRLFDHAVVELAFHLHLEEQHLVVRSARKEYLARVQLVKCTTDRPHVDGSVIW